MDVKVQESGRDLGLFFQFILCLMLRPSFLNIFIKGFASFLTFILDVIDVYSGRKLALTTPVHITSVLRPWFSRPVENLCLHLFAFAYVSYKM